MSITIPNFALQPVEVPTLPANDGQTLPVSGAALTAIATALADVSAKLVTIDGRIDGLEGLVTAGNASATTIATAVTDNTPAAVTVAQLPATVGPKTAATSLSMAFATDGTQPLPTGAATETTLGALNTKTATLGRKVSTGSAPVVLASDHANVPTAPDGVSDAVLTAAWDGSALPTTGYGAAIITVSAIAGGASIGVTGSLTGATDHPVAIINLATNTIVSAITTVGIYQVTAVGSLKYVKTGGTATVNVLLKR